MRRIRYAVAASLDGFIAGPNGEFDWIPMDPTFDFAALFAQFDTFLMGSKTYLITRSVEPGPSTDSKVYVFSRSLRQEDHPDVTIVSDDQLETVRRLRKEPGKDIWLFGGGELFRWLAAEGEVDSVEVGVVPILLGNGIPLFGGGKRVPLTLRKHNVYPSGIVSLEYDVAPGS